MAVLGFTDVGSGLLTLLVLVVWVGFWFVGPIITFIGVAMSGGGGKKGVQGQVMYTTVFLAFALAGATGIWFLTLGDWPLRIVFLVAPAGAWFWMAKLSGKGNGAMQAQAEAFYAQAKAAQAQVTPEAQESAAADAQQLAADKTDRPDVVTADTNLTDLLMGNTKDETPKGPGKTPPSQP